MYACEVLVAVEYGNGRGGVVRDDDGQIWLSCSVDRIGGLRLCDCRPAYLVLDDKRILHGGLLQSGAISAEVVNDHGRRVSAVAANGAWAVVLEHAVTGPVKVVVCSRDAQGRPVAPELPANSTRTAVSDTAELCPACGAVAWDEVRLTDQSRGPASGLEGGTEPTRLVVCRICGHQERMVSVTRFEARQPQDAAEVVELTRVSKERQRAETMRILDQVRFPVYAVDGWPASFAGHGGRTEGLGGPMTHVKRVTVSHGSASPGAMPNLQIETAISERERRSESALARAALQRWLYDGRDDFWSRSDAALTLRHSARARERRDLAALAIVTDRLIEIDGSRQPFQYVEANGRWTAVRRSGTLTITVSGHTVMPGGLRLTPLADPARALLDAESD